MSGLANTIVIVVALFFLVGVLVYWPKIKATFDAAKKAAAAADKAKSIATNVDGVVTEALGFVQDMRARADSALSFI